MANVQEKTPPMQNSPAWQRWLETLATKRREMAIGLFVAAGLLAVIPAWVLYKHGVTSLLPVTLWGALLAVLVLGAGLWAFNHHPEGSLSEVDAIRLMVLILGGVAGLLTALMGLGLIYEWWSELSGGLESWRSEWNHVVESLLALFGGMVLMFASLQLARPDQGSNAGLRRLLYGYNAVLTGLVLAAILGLVNLLTYVHLWPFTIFSTPTDWTASNLFSLSPATRNVVASITKPVMVYVILPQNTLESQEVHALMDSAQALSNKIQVEYLSPDLSALKLGELRRKYQLLESQGILLIYGTEPNEEHSFIKVSEISSRETDAQGEPQHVFNGENAFISRLMTLTEGKSRAVVYFTQGNGEFALTDVSSERGGGLGTLKTRLEKANYEIKDLKLGPTAGSIPEDASVVVIVRPVRAFSLAALKALGDYMNPPAGKKGGKLIVLLDVVVDSDGAMVKTGLEDFLTQFNVQVNNDRIINPNKEENPLQIDIVPNTELFEKNPVVRAFCSPYVMAFSRENVRTVRPRPGNPDFAADTFLETDPDGAFWAETDLRSDPSAMVRTLLRPARAQELQDKLSKVPLPTAVVVTTQGAPPNPHVPVPEAGQEPRLAVFGNASWIANQYVSEEGQQANYVLFLSTLSWLRGRPEIGKTAEPKSRQKYSIDRPPEVVQRLEWLPALLMFVGIAGLGGGVWVVRRR